MNKPQWICRNCGQTSNNDVIDVDNEGICNLHPAGAGNHSWKRYVSEPTRKFHASWELHDPPRDLDEAFISSGIGDEQGMAYRLDDRDAELKILKGEAIFFVTLTVPTHTLEKNDGYWVIANPMNGTKGEVELI